MFIMKVEEEEEMVIHLHLHRMRAPGSEVLLLAPSAAAPTRGLPAGLLPLRPAAGTALGERHCARSGSVGVDAVVVAVVIA